MSHVHDIHTSIAELHADLFSRHAGPLEGLCFCGGRRKRRKMLCPTRFVADTTENSEEEGVAAEVCSSQTGLYYEQNRNATYYCSYLGHQNELSHFLRDL